MNLNDRVPRRVGNDIVVRIEHGELIEWTLTALTFNGFVLVNQKVKKKYRFFGKPVYYYKLMFNPSDECVQRWISNYEQSENYESALIWKKYLLSKNSIKQ